MASPHLTLPSGSRSPWHCRHRRPALGLGVVLSLVGPSCPASRQTCLTSARTTDGVSIQSFSRKSISRKVSDCTVGTAPSPEPSPTHALWTRGVWVGAGHLGPTSASSQWCPYCHVIINRSLTLRGDYDPPLTEG